MPTICTLLSHAGRRNMLIFWKTRYLNRNDRTFGDRFLYLDTGTLEAATRVAIELLVTSKSRLKVSCEVCRIAAVGPRFFLVQICNLPHQELWVSLCRSKLLSTSRENKLQKQGTKTHRRRPDRGR